jgi:hypothetical protein
MKKFKSISTLRRLGLSLLVTTVTFQSITPVLASENQNKNIVSTEELTTEELDSLLEKMTDDNYSDYEFDIDDTTRDVLWGRLINNAEDYVANLSAEELAEIDSEIEAMMLEREYFYDSLSPEFLLETYLEYNREILRMRSFNMLEFEEEMEELYQMLTTFTDSVDGFRGPVDDWVYIFSRDDAVPSVNIRAIEAQGALAAMTSQTTGNAYNWARYRTDAYRHWVWNVFATGSVHVGANFTTRYNRTRIVTTNRELATAIIQAQPSLNVRNPNASQIAMGRYLRSVMVSFTQIGWTNHFNTPDGRDVQMDLWNNYWGRIDSRNLTITPDNMLRHFNNRWNDTGVNTGLVRNTGTGTTGMSLARQNRLWTLRKHYPHSW